MICQISIRNAYGNVRIYPENTVAEHLLAIQGGKTLQDATIERIKLLGFTIEVKPQTI